MNPRICTVKHNPPESYGDCVRACIATLLDRDDVPHVFKGADIRQEKNMMAAWAELRKWMAEHKKFLALFPAEDHVDFMLSNNPDVPYILWCHTSDGNDHTVLCKNGKVIHDPAWYRSEIIGPLSTTGFYIIGIVGNLL